MAPIRIGFIGLSVKGWASSALVNPLFDPLLSSSYTLTALCTTSEVTAAAAATKYTELAGRPVKAYHGDAGLVAIANDPEVDLVAVSVKIPDHYKAVMPAIEAGKDIFIEWTVGNGYAETVKIAEAAKRKGVRVLVGAQAIQSSSMRKVKEIVDSGKIGRVLSTTMISAISADMPYWGKLATPSTAYAFDINNGATIITIPLGHFLTALTHILGDFVSVSATGVVQLPTASIIDSEGKPTGETIQKTSHDQIAITGILAGKDGAPGTFVNLQTRGLLPITGEHGRGRTVFIWIIDGEFGTIEVQNRKDDTASGPFVNLAEKRVLLNGEEVHWEPSEADRLDNTGKAWLEFAKGSEGKYWGIDESVKVDRVLDAALTSIKEGRRVDLA